MRCLYTLFALFYESRICCGVRGATDWCQAAFLIALIALIAETFEQKTQIIKYSSITRKSIASMQKVHYKKIKFFFCTSVALIK